VLGQTVDSVLLCMNTFTQSIQDVEFGMGGFQTRVCFCCSWDSAGIMCFPTEQLGSVGVLEQLEG